MNIINTIDKLGNIGVKASYKPWEIYLTRKLNFLSLIGVLNVSITVVSFYFLEFNQFILECLITLAVGPFVIFLNAKKNYVWAGYLFYLIGIVLFYFMTIQMGLDTFFILFYFPIFVSLIHVFGRKETLMHLFIIAGLFFLSIIAILLSDKMEFSKIQFSEEALFRLRMFNILSSFFLTTLLICMLTIENVKQESLIKNMLKEKEILLAEVFHRVKNNMNIVTSLLNLKKFASKSEEVKAALEECRERVFSMALVHQKIYENKNTTFLNFKEYIDDLVAESIKTIGGTDNVDVVFKTEKIDLPLFYAIPCGLILNELITNSFKHAQQPDRRLHIEIEFKKVNEMLLLKVKDNGPGFNYKKNVLENSLGLELIKSLTEQIDGKCNISNQNGYEVEIWFENN
ncbi:MAG: sensor histidine kinase [Bacteroidota bacterium]